MSQKPSSVHSKSLLKTSSGEHVHAKTHNQKKLVDAIEENDIIFVNGPAGTGKAQPLYSLLVTPSGFITMGEVSAGDLVIGKDGNPTEVLSIHPQGEKPIYRVVFSDGSSADSCNEHLWDVSVNGGDFETKSLEDIEKIVNDGNSVTIPTCSAVKFGKKNLDNDPYAVANESFANNRMIPIEYLTSTIEDRVSLLNGLADSWGKIEDDGTLSLIASISMTRQIEMLVQSLGGFAEHIEYTNGLCTVFCYMPDNFNPFRDKVLAEKWQNRVKSEKYMTEREIESISYLGLHEAKCIKVAAEDQLYLTDAFIVTHNTFVSTVMAIKGIEDKVYDKLVVTRPAIEAGENLGFLPGDLSEKIAPYMKPVYGALSYLRGKKKRIEDSQPAPDGYRSPKEYKRAVDRNKAAAEVYDKQQRLQSTYALDFLGDLSGKVEVAPIAFMRGETFSNAFILCDEAQNITKKQMEMLLTRMGEGSKIVICGDAKQCDLKPGQSGFVDAQQRLHDVDGIAIVELTLKDVCRHGLVKKVIERYADESYQKDLAEGRA